MKESAAKTLRRRREAALAWPAVDLSDRAGNVAQQGARPLCVPLAVAAAHESQAHGDGTAFVPAVEPLWWWLVRRGLAGADGTLLPDAGAAVADVGQCHEDLWPFDASLGHGTQEPPPAAGPAPWRRTRMEPVPLTHDGVEEPIEAALAFGQAVMLVLEVTDEFDYPAADGFIPVPDIRAPSGGYHAVVIEGAWTEPLRGRVFLIRNSWGAGWGSGGFALLPPAYLIAHAAEAGALNA